MIVSALHSLAPARTDYPPSFEPIFPLSNISPINKKINFCLLSKLGNDSISFGNSSPSPPQFVNENTIVPCSQHPLSTHCKLHRPLVLQERYRNYCWAAISYSIRFQHSRAKHCCCNILLLLVLAHLQQMVLVLHTVR
jgi:hypothetical protein